MRISQSDGRQCRGYVSTFSRLLRLTLPDIATEEIRRIYYSSWPTTSAAATWAVRARKISKRPKTAIFEKVLVFSTKAGILRAVSRTRYASRGTSDQAVWRTSRDTN